MKILSTRLKGYARFTLGNITLIELSYNAIHQIFIGTNGAGKSSLMEQCSPLPPSNMKKDFPNGGYKETNILHNGKRYFCKSSFDGKTAHHIFTIDGGDNLNTSRKETEQRKLVHEHFGLTPALFALILGKLKFTDMTSNQRRDWLMAISGIDFNYVMKLQQKVKDFNKDAIAITKNLVEREISETNRLSKMRNPNDIESEIKLLRAEINLVMAQKTNVDRTQYTSGLIDRILQKMEEASRKLLTLDIRYPKGLPYVSDEEGLHRLSGEVTASDTILASNLTALYQRKEKIEHLTNAISADITDMETFIEDTDFLRAQANEIIQNANRFFIPNDEANDSMYVSLVADNLGRLFSIYPNNQDRIFTAANRSALVEEEKMLRVLVGELNANITDDRAHRKHMLGLPSIDCPKCEHTWTPGLSEVDVANIEARMEANVTLMNERTKRLDEVTELLEEFTNLVQLRAEILRTMADSEITMTLKASYLELEKNGANSRKLTLLLSEWVEGMQMSKDYQHVSKQIEDNDLAIYHAGEMEQLDQNHRASIVSQLDQEIDSCLRKRELTKTTQEILKKFLGKLNEAKVVRETILKSGEDLARVMEKHVDVLRDEQIDDYLGGRQSTLAIAEKEMSDLNAMFKIIENLTEYRVESEKNIAASKELLNILSPSNGLIAEYVTTFLSSFVEEMNKIIEAIWTYEMRIQNCDVNGGELDYKFPVKISEDPLLRDDVKDTSSAQEEMINMAFRLAVMTFLDQYQFPLYLDEFGKDMDEAHRFNIMAFIKSYVESGRCSQMFMISHYVASHGVFTNAEICVLDQSNIINRPTHYNKHVKITK